MAITTTHCVMSMVDSSGNINIIYPQNTGSDVIITPNTTITSTTLQGMIDNFKTVVDGLITAKLPTVNNGTLTIQRNGTNVQTFTANQSSNVTANITVPTKVSELTNDSGYTTNTGTVTSVKVGSTSYSPSSGVVSLPAYPSDTNTHRPIQMNGTEILGNNTTALNLKAGSNVTLSNSSGTVTISASSVSTTRTLLYDISFTASGWQTVSGPNIWNYKKILITIIETHDSSITDYWYPYLRYTSMECYPEDLYQANMPNAQHIEFTYRQKTCYFGFSYSQCSAYVNLSTSDVPGARSGVRVKIYGLS